MNVRVGGGARIDSGANVLAPASSGVHAPLVEPTAQKTEHHLVRVVAGPFVDHGAGEQYADPDIDDVTVVRLGSNEDGEAESAQNAPYRVHSIREMDALAELGVVLETRLSNAGPNTTVELHFEALDALLDEVPLRTAFVFLATITTLVRHHDAAAIYWIDQSAHDPQVVATLAPLFDARLD